MRKLLVLLSLFAFVAGSPQVLLAKEHKKSITATVQDVNPEQKKITVTGPEGNKAEYTLSNKTKIETRSGQTLNIADLKAGSSVKITYKGTKENPQVTKVEVEKGE